MPATLAETPDETLPDVVRPSTGTLTQLRKGSEAIARTLGEQLDRGHDWLYRRTEQWISDLDLRFGSAEAAPAVVPLSPLRLGVFTDVLHTQRGFAISAQPEIEATLHLPNLEHRLRLFISTADLAEAPSDPGAERPPLRAGLRFLPLPHLEFELGARAKIWPSAFAALRWTPQFELGSARGYAFVKPYLESGIGLGVGGGLALEWWRNRWFVRSASYANWVRNESATAWQQSLIAGYARALIQERQYDRLADGHDLACGVALRASVSGDRLARTSLFEVNLVVKRPVHGGWLYAYAEPLVIWDRKFNWHPDLGIRIGLDALFWGLSSPASEAATYCGGTRSSSRADPATP